MLIVVGHWRIDYLQGRDPLIELDPFFPAGGRDEVGVAGLDPAVATEVLRLLPNKTVARAWGYSEAALILAN